MENLVSVTMRCESVTILHDREEVTFRHPDILVPAIYLYGGDTEKHVTIRRRGECEICSPRDLATPGPRSDQFVPGKDYVFSIREASEEEHVR